MGIVKFVVNQVHDIDLREDYVGHYLKCWIVSKVDAEQYEYESSGSEYEVTEHLHPVPIFESLVQTTILCLGVGRTHVFKLGQDEEQDHERRKVHYRYQHQGEQG